MDFIKKNILIISMYFLMGILVVIFFFVFSQEFLSVIRGTYCSFSTVAEFVVNLIKIKHIIIYILSFLFTMYGLLWLLIKKMQKIKVFNSVMVCSLLWILLIMLDLLNIPMVILALVALVILCIYVNKKTPYITGNKSDGLDYAAFSFSLLLVFLKIYFLVNSQAISAIFITLAYLLLIVILFICKKRVYFDIAIVFSFVSILSMLPNGIQNYVINSNTGETYKSTVEIQNVVDLLIENFELYKDVLEVKAMFNFQFYLFLLLMITVLLLVSFKCCKIFNKKSNNNKV